MPQRTSLGFNLSFSNLNLQDSFVASIEAAGYQSPTDLQTKLIPLVGERKSVLVWSQSAAGKTGAFLIPAVNYILANPLEEKRGARILILTSRRDRVSQINYTLKRLTRDHNMRFGFIVSGRPYQPQMRLMRRPLDMMVATPGRLGDLVDNNKADFSQLEMLIIDDMTTIYQKNMHPLINKIMAQTKQDCPVIAFVRYDEDVNHLAKELLPEAVEIEGLEGEDEELPVNTDDALVINVPTPKSTEAPKKTFPEHPQHVYVADDYTHKIALMDHFLDELAGEPTVIYVSTTKAASVLQDNLANLGHVAELAHDLKPNEISSTDTPTLIVSDQKPLNLPSGQDQHIIHFDLPFKLDNYRKRIDKHDQNREDAMIILADGNDYDALQRIEKAIGSSIEQHTAPGLEPLNPFVSTQPAASRSNSSPRKSTPKTNAGTNKRQPRARGGAANASASKKPTIARKNTRKPAAKTAGAANTTNNKTNNPRSRNSGTDDKENRRQRKGPYGRLNGGAQRKRNDVGVSSVGTQAPAVSPMSNKDWDNAVSSKNKPEKEKRVVIRYKDKKRTLIKEDPGSDA